MVRTSIFLVIFSFFVASVFASAHEPDGQAHTDIIDFELDRMVDETIAEIPEHDFNGDANDEDDGEAVPHSEHDLEGEESMVELPSTERTYQDDIPHVEDIEDDDDAVPHVSRKLLAAESEYVRGKGHSRQAPKGGRFVHEAEKMIRIEDAEPDDEVNDEEDADFDEGSIPETVHVLDDENMDEYEDEDDIDVAVHKTETDPAGSYDDDEYDDDEYYEEEE